MVWTTPADVIAYRNAVSFDPGIAYFVINQITGKK